MVKNDEKHDEKVPFLSCAREAHVRHMKKNEEKNLLVSFRKCKRMGKHALADRNTQQ